MVHVAINKKDMKMKFGMNEQMSADILKLTAEIAGRIASSGQSNTSPRHAATQARHVMTELLGLKSMNFELMQTAFVVNGFEVSVELKDEDSRFEHQALHGKPVGEGTPEGMQMAAEKGASVLFDRPGGTGVRVALGREGSADFDAMEPQSASEQRAKVADGRKMASVADGELSRPRGNISKSAVALASGITQVPKADVEEMMRRGGYDVKRDGENSPELYSAFPVETRPKMVGHYPVELDGSSERAPIRPATQAPCRMVTPSYARRMVKDPLFDAASRKVIDKAAAAQADALKPRGSKADELVWPDPVDFSEVVRRPGEPLRRLGE